MTEDEVPIYCVAQSYDIGEGTEFTRQIWRDSDSLVGGG